MSSPDLLDLSSSPPFFGDLGRGELGRHKKKGSQVGFEEVWEIVGNEEFLHKSHIKIKDKHFL